MSAVYSSSGGASAARSFRRQPNADRPSMKGNPPEDDVEVRPEDQKAINTFGRLNNRKNDIEEEIKEKQQFHDLLDDASNEIILADDDEPVRYGFGECYFECSKDQAEELLEKQKEDTQAEIGKLKGELSTIHDTLSGLKTQLYGRFGNNINLEETPGS